MGTTVIQLRDVSKQYKLYESSRDRAREALSLRRKSFHKVHNALSEIDLEICKVEILGFVGRNGSGKSTLLKLIAGVLKPNSGSLQVCGRVTALLELGAGFNPEFTGVENIHFYASILGLSEREIALKLEDIIQFAEIGEYIHQPIKTYSSGMRARLSFAVAIHVNPEILILDEVLSVGDAPFRRKCYAKMEEMFASGKTIIYVSHNADSVRSLCTRAIFLHDSRVVMDGDPAEVTKAYERIAFARPNAVPGILNELTSGKPIGHKEDKPALLPEDAKSDSGREYLIEDFKPKSTVDYANAAVQIRNSCFRTRSGREINVLCEEETYYYCYDVFFDEDCSMVSFNFMLKGMLGTKISGCAMHLTGEKLDSVAAGTVVHVKWSFDCSLLEGTYLTNIGVVTTESGEREFLARKVDANILKVVGERGSIVSGIVNLNQKVSIEVS